MESWEDIRNGIVNAFTKKSVTDLITPEEVKDAQIAMVDKVKESTILRYNDDSEALDIVREVDVNTGELIHYKEVTKFYDNTNMTDAKCDGIIYRKKGDKYLVETSFLSKNELHVSLFGAKGDGTTDDTVAIQNAFNMARQMSQNTNGYTGASSKIIFNPRVYCISASITINIAYPNIEGNGAVIVPHSSIGGVGGSIAQQNFWGLNFVYFWVGNLGGLKIKGFQKGLRLFNPNTDTGNIYVKGIHLMNCNEGLYVNLRSSQCTFDDIRITDTNRNYIRQCDKIVFRGGWINDRINETKKWSALFDVDYSAIVTFQNIIFTPQQQTLQATELFWIKMKGGSILNILDCQIGGESGQHTIVGVVTGAALGRGVNVNIRNTQAFCSESPWVMLFNMPNVVNIDNWTGTVDATHNYSIVHYASDAEVASYNTEWPVQSLPTPEDPNDPNPSQPQAVTWNTMISNLISIERISVTGGNGTFEVFTPTQRKMLRFFVGANAERFGYYQIPHDGTMQDLLFDSKNNSINAWNSNRYRAWEVTLVNAANSGPGRVSKYLISAEYGKSFTYSAIFEGTSTVSPILRITSDVVKVGISANIAGNIYARIMTIAPLDAFEG